MRWPRRAMPRPPSQEWAQARGLEVPAYDVVATDGPPHDPHFTVQVRLAGLEPARGLGRKRAAEREAAQVMLGQVLEHGR